MSLQESPATPEARIGSYLRALGINRPVRPFVTLVSNTYHQLEANGYDAQHLEIHETTAQWNACLDSVDALLPPSIRVLDLGAGTGFAAERVVRRFGERVGWLVCQDLSADMIQSCRRRLAPLTGRAHFVTGDPECLRGGVGRFDLVVTNAVLHHLLDLAGFLTMVQSVLKPGGVYVAGHEPSTEFYAHEQLYKWTERYRRWRRVRRAVSPRAHLRRLRLRRPVASVEQQTNAALLRAGAIAAPLPAGVIRQLVDIHVPPAQADVPFWGERGFNPRGLCETFLEGFTPTYLVTYPHIKEARARMGWAWRWIDRRLADKYPNSGANFLLAARKTA